MKSTTRLIVTALLSLSLVPDSAGYVVHTSGLPKHKQLPWLNTLTENIITTKPGTLSKEKLSSTNKLISAWAQMDTLECALKVETLFKRVIDERRAGNMDATMTLEDYNVLLEGWARSKAGRMAAERCEQILYEMQEHSDIVPDYQSFSSVLAAWKYSNDPDAAVRAQRVLEYWMELFTSGRNRLALPDADSFDVVLQLWARSARGQSDAPMKTEQLVLGMERLYHATKIPELQPRTSTFNAVLSSWSHSQRSVATKHMLDILRFMEKHAKLGDTSIEPDIISYSTCIAGLARAGGSAATAEKLLRKVEESAVVQTEGGNAPDTILYNSVIAAWARDTRSGSFRKARSVLDRQMNLHYEVETSEEETYSNCKPDVFGFTSVMASCAMEPKEKYKAFQMALATFQQLRHSDYGSPNHVTYGTMLKCCAKLLRHDDPMRKKWAKKVMNMCIADGCVGEMAMGRFREAACGDLFRETMQGIDKKNPPQEWTRNVVERNTVRRKRSRRRAEV